MINIDNPLLFATADALGAAPPVADAGYSGVSIDTRTIGAQELFFALKGPHFDGHDYLVDARKKKAAAAVVETARTDVDLPQLVVADSKKALQTLAFYFRSGFHGKVIGITGSAGKTTVKEMTACILEHKGKGLKTEGNLNNDLGVSLTLLRLKSGYNWAVIEMGANAPGEIRELAELTRPDISVVNNVGEAHIEGFGSVDEVAFTKGQIYAVLPPEGTAVIPCDSKYLGLWQKLSTAKNTMTFGEYAGSDISLNTDENKLVCSQGVIGLKHLAPHNKRNAAAASALALAAGMDIKAITDGLANAPAIKGRLEPVFHPGGAQIYDDTYNANPLSVRAAIDFLKTCDCDGNTFLVLGDMAELGADAVKMHEEAGEYARNRGISMLVSVGKLAANAALRHNNGKSFAAIEEAAKFLRSQINCDSVILVKGSRFMRMERLVAELFKEEAA